MRRIPGIGTNNIPGLMPFGIGQQTMATQTLTQQLRGKSSVRRTRKKRAKVANSKRRVRRARRGARPARLVKGSAAAKRYMASIRRKRRR